MVFLTISTLPCRLAEGSHSPPCIGKFPRCLVATRSPLPQAEQMCSNIWSGRVYAFKDTTPTHTRQKQPGERLVRAGLRLCAFHKLPRTDGSGESYLSTQEASLGYIMSQGQPGLHSETVSNK